MSGQQAQLMKGAMMRLGSWRIERTLGRDLCGTYFAGARDGQRATLYAPSGALAISRGASLPRLLELHRRIAHPGLIGFRDLDHDSDDVFLIGDAAEDVLASLRSGRRPTPGQTRAVGAALAEALISGHDGGLVHGGLELDNVLWAPDHAPRILGTGIAPLITTDRVVPAHGDVVGLGRLLCAMVASWSPRGSGGSWTASDHRTVELVRMLADPGAGISMREAHALLAGGDPAPAARATSVAPQATAPGSGARGLYVPDGDERGAGTPSVAMTEIHALGERDALGAGLGESLTEGSRTEVLSPGAAFGDALPAPDSKPGHAGGQLGRYRILTRLGYGGMGEVFLAEDPALRRGVAIKRIRPGLEHDRSFRARLRREAQLAAHLSHRAIVQVFDLITEDDVDHLVMEYVPGPSLHALLAGKPMPVGEAVRIATEIADGLAYAHQQGVVHRDLKLENILISVDGQPKIGDFGIARRTAAAAVGDHAGHDAVTRDGLVVGTSRAMSPEQIQGLDVDARSDLFSFGVMLYELVTGTSPFAANVDTMTILRVLGERQPPACRVESEVPRALSDLIDHLLEKTPAQRPESARVVHERLCRVLDNHGRSGLRDGARADDSWWNGSAARPVESELPLERSATAPIARPSARGFADGPVAAVTGSFEYDRPAAARDQEMQRLLGSWRADQRGPGTEPGNGRYPSAPRNLKSRIQAPFVLAEIRALRASVFKKSPAIQSALAVADKVEQAYDLSRADLFIPAFETWCAILEPFAMTVLTGTLRRIGYEIFPQYVSILGIPALNVKPAMDLKKPADLVRVICDAYSKCVVGPDAGTLLFKQIGARVTVTDSTFIPCQLQMGVFLGAGKLTGLFRDTALTEKSCRVRGDRACMYDFAF